MNLYTQVLKTAAKFGFKCVSSVRVFQIDGTLVIDYVVIKELTGGLTHSSQNRKY